MPGQDDDLGRRIKAILDVHLTAVQTHWTGELSRVERKADDALAQNLQLDRDLFGNRNRPDDRGALGEQRQEIADLRSEWRGLKLWIQGLIGSLLVGLISAIIFIIAAHH